jgi:hypothetical protein
MSITRSTPRPIYVVRLRPEPNIEDPVRMLRRVLKDLLRLYGMRCLQIDEEKKP